MKACKKCGMQKPLTEFYKSGTSYRSMCKECYNANRRTKEYRESVKDANRRASERYREANKELCRERSRNADTTLRRTPDGKERARESSKSWCRQQYATSPSYRLKQKNRAHARRCIVESEAISDSQWYNTLSTFNCCCAYCGATGDLTMDHVIPLSRGGTNGLRNVIPACASCNTSKGAKDMLEWYKAKSFFSIDRLAIIERFINDEK